MEPFGQYTDSYYYGNRAAGVLPICTKTKKILLGYRSVECNEPHTWGLFGGKAEGEEPIEEIAMREFYEETGCNVDVELLPALVFRDKSHGFEYHNFVGLVDEEFTPRLNWENEKAKWFTYQEALDLKYDLHFGLSKWLQNLRDYYSDI